MAIGVGDVDNEDNRSLLPTFVYFSYSNAICETPPENGWRAADERLRLDRIARNQAGLRQLGFGNLMNPRKRRRDLVGNGNEWCMFGGWLISLVEFQSAR